MINERQSYSNDRAVEIKTIGHFECQKNPTKVEFSLMKALRILTECSEKYFFPAIARKQKYYIFDLIFEMFGNKSSI